MYFLCCMKSSEFSFVYVKYVKRILMMAALKAVSLYFVVSNKGRKLVIHHLNPPLSQTVTGDIRMSLMIGQDKTTKFW